MIKRLVLLISIIALIIGFFFRETTAGSLLLVGTIVTLGTMFMYTMMSGCWPSGRFE